MGSVGWPEIIAILVVALLLFGPKRLPELGRSLGHTLREFRRAARDLSASIEDVADEKPGEQSRPDTDRPA